MKVKDLTSPDAKGLGVAVGGQSSGLRSDPTTN